jgi:hypothetical protein
MRNVLAHAGKSGRRPRRENDPPDRFLARLDLRLHCDAFAQDTAETASTQGRAVADQIRSKVPKLATIMDDAEADVLAYMTFPKEHRAKLHSTNPIERLNGEIERRTEVVGVRRENGPPDRFLILLTPQRCRHHPLAGALLLEQNDEWAAQRARYMTLETMAPLSVRQGIGPPDQFLIFLTPMISLPVVAR